MKKEKEHNKCVTIRVEKKVNDDWDMIYQSSALLNGTKLYYTSEDSKERQHFESSWNPWADDATIWHCFIIICQFTYPLWGRVLFISSELQPVIRCFLLASYSITEDNNGFKKFQCLLKISDTFVSRDRAAFLAPLGLALGWKTRLLMVPFPIDKGGTFLEKP